MQLSTKLGVDSGSISFVDVDYILKNGGEPNLDLELGIMLSPGKYKIVTSIDTKVIEDFKIDLPSGELIVGDLCYSFNATNWSSPWSLLLDKTDYFRKNEKGRHTIGTGGDGEFDVHITLTRIK